ncbi:MAG: hypothetical protein JOZ38_03485 [Candidatus Eremiobacteraeota bacterium]|nr:hypothetical protein [Candidatus Eremiobacteraeota bacterium]
MSEHGQMGHAYLAALAAELQALLDQNGVLRQLSHSAEVIAATPRDIEERMTDNQSRIRRLTEVISEISAQLSSTRVSDF